mgnify:FL=1
MTNTFENMTGRALRKLVTTAGWKEYRTANSIDSSSNMRKGELLEAARVLVSETPTPAPVFDVAAEIDDLSETPAANPAANPTPVSDPLASLRDVLSPSILESATHAVSAVVADLGKAREELARAKSQPAFAPVSGATPTATPAVFQKSVEFKALFGGRKHSFPVETFSGARSPAIDPDYHWPDVTPFVVQALEAGKPVFLYGPRGTGKSSFGKQYAAQTRRPFFLMQMNKEKAFADMFGYPGLDGNGGMSWQPGDLLKAMQTPNAVISLDEIGFGRPGLVSGPLQTLLEEREIILTDGTLAQIAPGVKFIVTNNNSGSEAHPGTYAGLETLNAAFRDRFALFVEIDYLAPSREKKALIARTGCQPGVADQMIAFANLTRNAAKKEDMSDCVGFRRLVAWADMLGSFPGDAKKVFDLTVRDIFTDDDKVELDQLASVSLNHDGLGQLAQGLEVKTEQPAQEPNPFETQDTETRLGFEQS